MCNFFSFLHLIFLKNVFTQDQVWQCTPLIPALRRLRWISISRPVWTMQRVLGQPGLLLDYTVRPISENQNQEKEKRKRKQEEKKTQTYIFIHFPAMSFPPCESLFVHTFSKLSPFIHSVDFFFLLLPGSKSSDSTIYIS